MSDHEPGTTRVELTLPNGKKYAVVTDGECSAANIGILLDDWAKEIGKDDD
jgi:hypothetical protein